LQIARELGDSVLYHSLPVGNLKKGLGPLPTQDGAGSSHRDQGMLVTDSVAVLVAVGL
jgi:hypothetical protein